LKFALISQFSPYFSHFSSCLDILLKMTGSCVVSSAQNETKSILANLQKGQILLATTSKDIKPMMFAWEGANTIEALKRMSETSTVFPAYPIAKIDRTKAKSTKQAIAPFPLDAALQGKEWESENQATYHNIAKGTVEVAAMKTAGFKSHDHVQLPTQFAWARMNEGGASDAAEAAEGMSDCLPVCICVYVCAHF